MNQTTNYNFNVPVGSDIVNPLVQDFPNWESLDTILRNVANTGITTATHTKTGTIHTLTFSETSIPMIRFQATADFNTNDTFTVNGVSVSALTVSGQALPDGSFVIGSMVLCELRDNLLTVYASGTDADTLEGHSASYFATASDLETVDDKADANKALIDQINIDLVTKLNQGDIEAQGFVRTNQQIGTDSINDIVGTWYKVKSSSSGKTTYINYSINYNNQTPATSDTIRLDGFPSNVSFSGYNGTALNSSPSLSLSGSANVLPNASKPNYSSSALSLVGLSPNAGSGACCKFSGILY